MMSTNVTMLTPCLDNGHDMVSWSDGIHPTISVCCRCGNSAWSDGDAVYGSAVDFTCPHAPDAKPSNPGHEPSGPATPYELARAFYDRLSELDFKLGD